MAYIGYIVDSGFYGPARVFLFQSEYKTKQATEHNAARAVSASSGLPVDPGARVYIFADDDSARAFEAAEQAARDLVQDADYSSDASGLDYVGSIFNPDITYSVAPDPVDPVRATIRAINQETGTPERVARVLVETYLNISDDPDALTDASELMARLHAVNHYKGKKVSRN